MSPENCAHFLDEIWTVYAFVVYMDHTLAFSGISLGLYFQGIRYTLTSAVDENVNGNNLRSNSFDSTFSGSRLESNARQHIYGKSNTISFLSDPITPVRSPSNIFSIPLSFPQERRVQNDAVCPAARNRYSRPTIDVFIRI